MTPTSKNILMAKSRVKKKQNEVAWAEHLEKDRIRKRASYHVKKMTITKEESLNLRNQNRLKQQRFRERKQMMKMSTEMKNGNFKNSYKCKQSFGKAVRKAVEALPKSPTKRKAVVMGIVRKTFDSQELQRIQNNMSDRTKENQNKSLVQSFYCTDEISRQAPGKRDVKSIKNEETGKRELIPIRHMMMNISDAYYEFTNQYPDIKISLAYFFSFRPKFVLLASQTPHNVCVCKKHLNFSFKVDDSNYKTLLDFVCCDQLDENCMFNNCENCKMDVQLLLPDDIAPTLNTVCLVKEWKEVNGFLQISNEQLKVCDLISKINCDLPHFKKHCFIKKIQNKYFEESKNAQIESEAIVQVDFSENATLTAQNQIQSAHWKQRQVTIFTCCIWNAGQVKSVAIISNDLSHSKTAVWIFLKKIAQFIKQKFPHVVSLKFFSDNAASQFRSKFTVSNLCFLDDDLDFLSIEWNTFAASHGKGAVDGVGGALKNLIWKKIRSENLNINSAKEYFDVAKGVCKAIVLFYVPEEDVIENELFLSHRWECVSKIELMSDNGNKIGLSSLHTFKKYDSMHVLVGETAVSTLYKIKVIKSNIPECDIDNDRDEYTDDFLNLSRRNTSNNSDRLSYLNVYSNDTEEETLGSPMLSLSQSGRNDTIIDVGSFVVVRSNNKKFIAICQNNACEENAEVLVLVMKSYGANKKNYKKTDDVNLIKIDTIEKILPAPSKKISGKREFYQFEDDPLL